MQFLQHFMISSNSNLLIWVRKKNRLSVFLLKKHISTQTNVLSFIKWALHKTNSSKSNGKVTPSFSFRSEVFEDIQILSGVHLCCFNQVKDSEQLQMHLMNQYPKILPSFVLITWLLCDHIFPWCKSNPQSSRQRKMQEVSKTNSKWEWWVRKSALAVWSISVTVLLQSISKPVHPFVQVLFSLGLKLYFCLDMGENWPGGCACAARSNLPKTACMWIEQQMRYREIQEQDTASSFGESGKKELKHNFRLHPEEQNWGTQENLL